MSIISCSEETFEIIKSSLYGEWKYEDGVAKRLMIKKDDKMFEQMKWGEIEYKPFIFITLTYHEKLCS